jgi:membrane glycosyltransferase
MKAAAESARIEWALREGPDALSANERFRLLSSPHALVTVRTEVVAHRAHPAWWQAPEPAQAAESRAVREVRGILAESL